MLSLLCVVNNDIFKSVYFYVYTNARPPGGPRPPPRHPLAAPRYVPVTRRFPPHISCHTRNATHDVAYVREVIVNHGECGVAMSAWVEGWCENGDDRPHTLKLDGSLKIPYPTPPVVTIKFPNIGENASHTRVPLIQINIPYLIRSNPVFFFVDR